MAAFKTMLLALVGALGMSAVYGAPVVNGSLATVQHTFMQAQVNMTSTSSSQKWASALSASGSWSDIDYTSGCPARRASWPAISHWSRLASMAISWYNDPSNNSALLSKIQLGMDYWFDDDYTSLDCVDQGGLTNATCPCGTPGLWNTNWYDQVIGVAKPASVACLFVKGNLSSNATDGCTRIMTRSWSRIDTWVYGLGQVTGANTLDVSSVGLALALFTANETLMQDVFSHANGQVITMPDPNDGLKTDGSFFQHDGVLYNGNYGMVFANDFLLFAAAAVGTPYEATSSQKEIFTQLLEGTEWMSFYDSVTNVLRWEYSSLGRMVSMSSYSPFDVNINQYPNGTSTWTEYPDISASAKRLMTTGKSANPGKLNGNKMFWEADYMIMRRSNYVVSLKMFSTRIRNTECVNLQNIKGYHLSDGLVYTYLTGNEYVDIFPTWDWYLLPGTTAAYGADPLTCDTASVFGNNSFVGGVSDGNIGVAAMQYTDPTSVSANTTEWNKGWFFFDNQYVVVGNNIRTNTNDALYSVLDQRKLNGSVYTSADAKTPVPTNKTTNYTNSQWLWHDNIGYVFLNNTAPTLSVSPSQQSGNWSSIAIDTTVVTMDVFKSYITHSNSTASQPSSLAYIADIGVSYSQFQRQAPLLKATIQLLANNPQVSSVLHVSDLTLGSIFWQASSLSLPTTSPFSLQLSKGKQHSLFSLSVDQPSIVLMQPNIHNGTVSVSVSDPTQSQTTLNLKVSNAFLKCPKASSNGFSCKSNGGVLQIKVTLPSGQMAGSSISGSLKFGL